jgi:hypothetical protein
MMRYVFSALMIAGMAGHEMAAQTPSAGGQVLGTVRLTQPVIADGKPLPPGTYELRLTGQPLPPLPGQTPGGEQYVEFVANGMVVGRDVAVVVTVAAGSVGTSGSATQPRVEMLRGGEFLRISTTRGGNRYLIHLPLRAAGQPRA